MTGIPQLPLTTLNSVVAVCQLSSDLFPARSVQPVLVSVSVGLMNMVGAWFGAMPCCHGAGGLAAQVRRIWQMLFRVKGLHAGSKQAAAVQHAAVIATMKAFAHPRKDPAVLLQGIELALLASDMAASSFLSTGG